MSINGLWQIMNSVPADHADSCAVSPGTKASPVASELLARYTWWRPARWSHIGIVVRLDLRHIPRPTKNPETPLHTVASGNPPRPTLAGNHAAAELEIDTHTELSTGYLVCLNSPYHFIDVSDGHDQPGVSGSVDSIERASARATTTAYRKPDKYGQQLGKLKQP